MSNLLKKTTLLFLLLLSVATAAAGQSSRAKAAGSAKARESDDEVERVLERYVLAQGGVALFKLKTRIVRGRVEMSESPIPGSFESYAKGMFKEMSIINAPMGQFISATDGVNRWRQAPWGAATSVGLGGSENLLTEAAKKKGEFKWRNAFAASRLKGRAQLDGREMIVLAVTPKGLEPILMYFDAETYLLRKQEPDRAGGSKESYLKAIYIDRYATVDGVKVAALFRVITTEFTLTFRVTEVRHNVEINDALFHSPEGK